MNLPFYNLDWYFIMLFGVVLCEIKRGRQRPLLLVILKVNCEIMGFVSLGRN